MAAGVAYEVEAVSRSCNRPKMNSGLHSVVFSPHSPLNPALGLQDSATLAKPAAPSRPCTPYTVPVHAHSDKPRVM